MYSIFPGMELLTDRQEAVLGFISSFLEQKKIPPTVREIQQHFRFRSPNAVTDHLGLLEKKGYLRRRAGLSRGIELAGSRVFSRSEVVEVPILGRIAAGAPLLAEENIEGYLKLDQTLIRGDGYFLLRVEGDSMKDAGIYHRDLVLVKKEPAAEPGEIVAAYWNHEATVKYFWPGPKGIELRPANEAYRPLWIDEQETDFRILGKVKAVLRVF